MNDQINRINSLSFQQNTPIDPLTKNLIQNFFVGNRTVRILNPDEAEKLNLPIRLESAPKQNFSINVSETYQNPSAFIKEIDSSSNKELSTIKPFMNHLKDVQTLLSTGRERKFIKYLTQKYCYFFLERSRNHLAQLLNRNPSLLNSVYGNIEKELFLKPKLLAGENLYILHNRLHSPSGETAREQVLGYIKEATLDDKARQAINLLLQSEVSSADTLYEQMKALKLSKTEIEQSIQKVAHFLFESETQKNSPDLAMSFIRNSKDLKHYLRLRHRMSKDLIETLEVATNFSQNDHKAALKFAQFYSMPYTGRSKKKKLRLELSNLRNEITQKYPNPSPEQKRVIAYLRAEKFKEIFFSPEYLPELMSMLQQATQQVDHPLRSQLQTALSQSLSEANIEKRLSFAKDPICAPNLFAEAFKNPNLLMEWQKLLQSDSEIAHKLKADLVHLSNSSPPGALKKFATLWSSTTTENVDSTSYDQIAISQNLLKELKKMEWMQLQACFPSDENLLEKLYREPNDQQGGINKLSIYWLSQQKTHPDGSSALEYAINSTPDFDEIGDNLLTNWKKHMLSKKN